MQTFSTLPVLYSLSSVPCEGEKRMKEDAVLFSCALGFLSEEDAAALVRQTALNTVIDLRTDEEDAELPDFQIPGVLYLFAPLPPAPCFPDQAEQIRHVLTSDEGLNALRRIFDVLLHRTGGAILLHCSDGHERCDIAASLLLLALGASPDCLPEGAVRDGILEAIGARGSVGAFFSDALGYRTDVLSALRNKFLS